MVFSSPLFLLFFLPVVLISYFFIPHKLRNLFLLLVSLFFYTWGEGVYVCLMLLVIIANYYFGISFLKVTNSKRTMILVVGIVINLLPLIFFKYSGFFLSVLNEILDGLSLPIVHVDYTVHLPIGISFFTFQALSYLVDTYKQTTKPQENIVNLGLYIALFPQLIAGPIVRYHDISKQIAKREISVYDFSYGIERFVVGLGKKVLLANPLGYMAQIAFQTSPDELSVGAAWLGAICYTLQIFYDFSGYSDMAIGLGRMFGFKFLENFNYPYVSKSIQDFWRRWHISLSNWFRDYLYIPLGGNRISNKRTILNLFVVFFLCGLWHGASWNFIVWGGIHGLFLALERGRFGTFVRKLPHIAQYGYTMFLVVIAWVFFRAETLTDAINYLGNLFGIRGSGSMPFLMVFKFDVLFLVTLILGIVFIFPIVPHIKNRLKDYKSVYSVFGNIVIKSTKISYLTFLLVLSLSALATNTYNPFIYFRF